MRNWCRFAGVKTILVALSCFGMSWSLVFGAEGNPRIAPGLFATVAAEKRIELRWQVDKWQKGQIGFHLFRRKIRADGAVGDWERLGPTVIRPDLSEDRLRELKLDRVLEKLKTRKVEDISIPAVLRKFAEQEGTGFRSFQLAGVMDYQHAQAGYSV